MCREGVWVEGGQGGRVCREKMGLEGGSDGRLLGTYSPSPSICAVPRHALPCHAMPCRQIQANHTAHHNPPPSSRLSFHTTLFTTHSSHLSLHTSSNRLSSSGRCPIGLITERILFARERASAALSERLYISNSTPVVPARCAPVAGAVSHRQHGAVCSDQ